VLRDKTRKPGKTPIAADTAARVVALSCTKPPHQATHWTGRAMAKATGISLGSVQRIWRAHQLQPHRLRTFKRSRDPSFAAKLTDIVGLYVDPPANAVVLSIDERARSKRSTAPSPDCRSSQPAGADVRDRAFCVARSPEDAAPFRPAARPVIRDHRRPEA
jgi:hypothetical protein